MCHLVLFAHHIGGRRAKLLIWSHTSPKHVEYHSVRTSAQVYSFQMHRLQEKPLLEGKASKAFGQEHFWYTSIWAKGSWRLIGLVLHLGPWTFESPSKGPRHVWAFGDPCWSKLTTGYHQGWGTRPQEQRGPSGGWYERWNHRSCVPKLWRSAPKPQIWGNWK